MIILGTMAGAGPQLVDLDAVRRHFGLLRMTLLRVAGAAHFAYAERPDLVWPASEQFLAGVWPAETIRP